MASSPPFVHTPESLHYTVNHAFFPATPDFGRDVPENHNALARAVCAAAHAYSAHVSDTTELAQWKHITKMLDNLQPCVQPKHSNDIFSQLQGMQRGDILAYFHRGLGAAIIFTKRENCVLYEAFEVPPDRDAVQKTPGAVTCSYPRSAVEMPNDVFDDEAFLLELAKHLSGFRTLTEPVPHPGNSRFINALLSRILQVIGSKRATCVPCLNQCLMLASRVRTVVTSHVTKRVRDHIIIKRDSDRSDLRRSPLWLLIRVAIHTILHRTLNHSSYKSFILLFLCTLARDDGNTRLSRHLLHLMTSTILRRLNKLGSSTPNWLVEMVLDTHTSLREILDARWKQLSIRQSPFQNPSQDELIRDTQLSLLNSRKCIHQALENFGQESAPTTFHPRPRRRGTIQDFLSLNARTFFDEAYDDDPDATLYEVERSIEVGIDDWVASVINVDEACIRLAVLMDVYAAKDFRSIDPERVSLKLLTMVELYVALDKLVAREVPLLLDYLPDIPANLLEALLLRKKTSLHRLSCVLEYFSVRQSQSRWQMSPLSLESENSFAVRYFDRSPSLQKLYVRIEEDAMESGVARTSVTVKQTDSFFARCRQQAKSADTSQSPLPSSPLDAKIAVFELQCPTCLRIWCSAIFRILVIFDALLQAARLAGNAGGFHQVADVPALRPHFVKLQRTGFAAEVRLGFRVPHYLASESPVRVWPNWYYLFQISTACYVIPTGEMRFTGTLRGPLWAILGRSLGIRGLSQGTYRLLREYGTFASQLPQTLGYDLKNHCSPCTALQGYAQSTSHTPNQVLAAQAECPTEFSLDEFTAFAHLRSGGSLQWSSILRGLHSRALNLRRHQVYFLISHAVSQVGPVDSSSRTWLWHQELQDSLFCKALLDELEGLIADFVASSMDSVPMNTLSVLLTRMLASSLDEEITEKAVALLLRIRRRTFKWVGELSYDLAKAPVSRERRNSLLKMAAACRSTFDVDLVTLRKLLRTQEDVDALLTCAFFIHTLRSPSIDDRFLDTLLVRDRHLSFCLEEVLKEVIFADPTNYGVDLAISRIFVKYWPGPCRLEQLQNTTNHWLACKSEGTTDQAPQIIHTNLLSGELQVAGQPLGGLPDEILDSPIFQPFFHDQGFLTKPSDLSGMDFMTLATMGSKCSVHFSLRDDTVMLRTQNDETSDAFVLIPSREFQGDLPPALIDGHAHWLNLSTKVIEIRPLDRLLEESAENWRIACKSGQYQMYRGNETLLDIQGQTWRMVAEYLSCLNVWPSDGRGNFMITTSPAGSASGSRLSISLPPYSLSFFVNDMGEVESRDFIHMVCDEDQTCGALLGLDNLLILRPKRSLVPRTLIHRQILVPNGKPKMHSDCHDRIQIDIPYTKWGLSTQTTDGAATLYHTYVVDTELGCLVGNGTLTSTEFLARLYAMTSWHRPDLLTGKMGTQAALDLLCSAGCRSIMKVKAIIETYGQYPQVGTAYDEIQRRYYWDRKTIQKLENAKPEDITPKTNAMKRAAYLFPSGAPVFPENHTRFTDKPSVLPALSSTSSFTVSSLRYLFNAGSPTQITHEYLMHSRPAPELPTRVALLRHSYTTFSANMSEIDQILFRLQTDQPFRQKYLAKLDASAQHARVESQTNYEVAGGENAVEVLEDHYVHCLYAYLYSLKILKKSLGPTMAPDEQAHDRFGQWPPITADVLLRYLASTSPVDVPAEWKKCLASLALLLLDLQRARRLLRFALDGLQEEFSKELETEGCEGWNPDEHLDWLLIQIQGNFLIRRNQADAAKEIIDPESGQNTVMQVNMGEGKSSVVIPIAAAALADGKQLVRVVVPKALTVQMFELLVARLGWLTNRPIYYLPFSRTSEFCSQDDVDGLHIDYLHKLMRQCVAEKGILLLQPEHVASLKLIGIEAQLHKWELAGDSLPKLRKLYKHVVPSFSSKQDNAHKWLSLGKWLDSYVRDILDESDEILHPRFQLIYTLGPEQHMDGYPDRWTITQEVLQLMKKHINSLSRQAPNLIQYECTQPGSFPHVRIMHISRVKQHLVCRITEDVMSGQLPTFRILPRISPALRNAIRSFISDTDALKIQDTVKMVEKYARNAEQCLFWSGLLQLRGLLTSDILMFALSQRRWRVDYGLIPEAQSDGNSGAIAPTLLAVPYRAKDVPAPNTQFGHPELTIILTCLSYYYAGLSEERLRACFEILVDEDDPSAEYALWIKQYDHDSMPDALRQPSELNLNPSEQWDKVIFPLFSRNQAIIDFYLSRVVFPKEAKEYPWKLSVSSWDLAEKRERLITGFSGTNDGQWLLPMSIASCDLEHQRGTNAKVLAYLLRPENGSYMMVHKNDEPWVTRTFLELLTKRHPEIRVLLDVGSLILDLSNRQVAKTWLDITHDIAGAIYFNEEDEIMVLTRSGVVHPLSSSPLSQQLDQCIVYLDHAHTRGTDIKLPIGSRAAVTLGPKVTKDALVQGCMRMRKLGCGHSVMFFAPPLVDQSIRDTSKIMPNSAVTTVDILSWAIHETWSDIERRAPYWAHQGMNYRSRNKAWSRFVGGKFTRQQLSDVWLQPELKSLTNLYAPFDSQDTSRVPSALDPDIRQHCKDLGVLSLPSVQMDEEQEREVYRERERERQVELPPKAEPSKHYLHPAVTIFVKTGIILPMFTPRDFRPVFTTLKKSFAPSRRADIWCSSILATADFLRTIKPGSTEGTSDQYLRPVEWVLSRTTERSQVLVLLSPFEANALLPEIRVSKHVHLHVYAPRTSKWMSAVDDLRLCTIPSLPPDWTPRRDLIDQLNVFAGQLYLKDYESYDRLCSFLKIPTGKKASPDKSVTERRTEFSISSSLKNIKIMFSGSPVPFVKALLAIRTRGKPFAHTHMGKILQGRSLTPEDFEPVVSRSMSPAGPVTPFT